MKNKNSFSILIKIEEQFNRFNTLFYKNRALVLIRESLEELVTVRELLTQALKEVEVKGNEITRLSRSKD